MRADTLGHPRHHPSHTGHDPGRVWGSAVGHNHKSLYFSRIGYCERDRLTKRALSILVYINISNYFIFSYLSSRVVPCWRVGNESKEQSQVLHTLCSTSTHISLSAPHSRYSRFQLSTRGCHRGVHRGVACGRAGGAVAIPTIFANSVSAITTLLKAARQRAGRGTWPSSGAVTKRSRRKRLELERCGRRSDARQQHGKHHQQTSKHLRRIRYISEAEKNMRAGNSSSAATHTSNRTRQHGSPAASTRSSPHIVPHPNPSAPRHATPLGQTVIGIRKAKARRGIPSVVASVSSRALRITHGTANGQRRHHQQGRPVTRKGCGQGGLQARVCKIKPCTSGEQPLVEASRSANATHAPSQHIEPTHRVREHSVPQQGVARRGQRRRKR